MTEQINPYSEPRLLARAVPRLSLPVHALRDGADKLLSLRFSSVRFCFDRGGPGLAQDLFQLSFEASVIVRQPNI